MTELLDRIISNHGNGGVKVISENHDLNSINWVAGLSDPGEMIRCGYLPEIRRRDGEQDKEYAARITPIVMKLSKADRDVIMKSAISRASLSIRNGRVEMFAAGELPWHGLGVLVDKAATSGEAIKLAGLNWTVSKQPLRYAWNGTHRESKTSWSIIRDDTGEELGGVGRVYKPIQNIEGFDFLDGVLQDFGARYETAGAIYGGKQVWMLAKFPEQAFAINGVDEVIPYAIFTNPHDGHGKAYCYPTSTRVVCKNTFRNSTSDRSKGIGIGHYGDLKSKIAEAKRSLGLSVKSFETFKDSAEAMSKTSCEIRPFAENVLDAVLEMTAARAAMGAELLAAEVAHTEEARKVEAKKFERQIEQRKELLEDILGRYDGERCGIGGMRGTTWAAFNAITEHADHGKFSRESKNEHERRSRHFESAIAGDADEMKQVAYEMAMKTLA